jgi:hypothetical protein
LPKRTVVGHPSAVNMSPLRSLGWGGGRFYKEVAPSGAFDAVAARNRSKKVAPENLRQSFQQAVQFGVGIVEVRREPDVVAALAVHAQGGVNPRVH